MTDRERTAETLTSWKEIASYLGRSVRTVRRWEKTEGLPIRRHLHQKASTVFANPEEVDAWLLERENRLQAEPAPEPEPEVTTRAAFPWRRVAAAATWVALGVLVGWLGRGAIERSAESGPDKLEAVLQGALEREIVDGALSFCADKQLDADCLLLRENVAQLRSADFGANYQAAHALAAYSGDLDRAQGYADRARDLLTDQVVSANAEAAAWVLLFDARRHWAGGRAMAALDSAAELEKTVDSWPPRLRSLLARDLGTLALALGQTATAHSWFERIADFDYRHEMVGWQLFAAGQAKELKTHLSEELAYREPFTAVLLAMVGETSQAKALLERVGSERLSAEHGALAQGAIAFFEGRTEEAVRSFEETLGKMDDSGDPIFFVGSDLLAMARQSKGHLDEAIDALEMTARQRDRAMFMSAGLHWIKCQSRLASYYEMAGMESERRATDFALRQRLRFADPDFPVLADLAARG